MATGGQMATCLIIADPDARLRGGMKEVSLDLIVLSSADML